MPDAPPPLCLLCRPDGTLRPVRTRQKEIHALLGGTPTFVGGIAGLGVFLVAKRGGDGPVNAAVVANPSLFHEEARGDVYLVGASEDGEEVDVDVEAVYAAWRE